MIVQFALFVCLPKLGDGEPQLEVGAAERIGY